MIIYAHSTRKAKRDSARLLDKVASKMCIRDSWLTCAAVLCIGCLCLFKYAGIFRTDVPLLLPAGISFYTFQTLSYVIDIYRGRLMPERHPGYYALFVSFFPQLVAGPIERSTDVYKRQGVKTYVNKLLIHTKKE